jgi:hypothetical protein
MRQLIPLFALLTLAAPLDASPLVDSATAASPSRIPRVRAGDSRSAVLLTKGLERSSTLRALVQQLEQRDVIVYIEMQPALKSRFAGMLTWIVATPTHRYVRVSINPTLTTDLGISTLGHELQHALEVANAPQVRCANSLEKYYAAHGDPSRSDRSGWDTEAARLAGEAVRREIATRSAVVADSIQEFDPDDWLIVYRRARGMLPP